MTKRSLKQKEVVSYALLRGKLIPRDEVLKQRLSLDENDDLNSAKSVSFDEMSTKQLKALLDKKDIEYKVNATKAELIELLDSQEYSELEIKEGE